MGGVRRVPVDSWNTTPSDVLVSTVVRQMYPHPGKAGQRYQSIAQGKTNTAAHPRMHTIYSTVQYCYEIDLVKKVHSAKIACWPLTVLIITGICSQLLYYIFLKIFL